VRDNAFRFRRRRACVIPLARGVTLCAAILAVISIIAPPVAAQSPFTEEALERGIDYHVQTWLANGINGGGYGVCLVDLNNNGHHELLASGDVNGLIGIWTSDGNGFFTDLSDQGIFPLITQAGGFAIGDYNGDGLLDVYIPRYIGQEKLFKNLGGLQFEDVTIAAGIQDDWNQYHATFGDYNGDGWLDLYCTNYCNPTDVCSTGHNRLYENLGNGTFVDVAGIHTVNDKGAGIHGFFYDFNRNGYPDIYLSNDRGQLFLFLHNRLYRNTGGQFEDITIKSGADYAAWAMGTAVGDFSLTGWDDVYSTNLAPSGYFINHGNYRFEEAAEEIGVMNGVNVAGWGAAFFDFDNDAMLDLYVANTSTPGGNRLYRNNGKPPASEVSDLFQVSVNKNSYCFSVADINNNGALDFVHQSMDDRLRLYINHEGQTRNWIKFRIIGPTPNRFAVGAMVDIRVGDTWQHRQIAGGNDYKGSRPHFLHFGLGDAKVVDEVIVRWPAHAAAEVVLTDVAANQTVIVPHPSLGN
jgi:enediyne biosynthesis protein E4